MQKSDFEAFASLVRIPTGNLPYLWRPASPHRWFSVPCPQLTPVQRRFHSSLIAGRAVTKHRE
ncbi:hypothetical protein B0H67DRAFT_579609 [Lasiosphaeris hirsuta]|uniref:Uncharacterized protein n=1 Tax=Lasiosphaeris hirsuta TaxID=260670 RepID=A0AA40AFM8_9PEZI|nr:hypothetical protein B0H67DRAFT_579609 [Lasiosphaeris hirsuta]